MRNAMKLMITAAAIVAAAGVSARAEGDAQEGERVYRSCAACHQVGDGARHGMGPHLNDLFGREAGSAEGYRYSPAMAEAGESGLVWTKETLAQHLADPRGFIPGNRMGFAGLRSDGEIADVIRYLEQFSQD
jgi:cytochrome c2